MARFSILTLLLCLTITAVVISGFNQFRQSQALDEQAARLEVLGKSQRIYFRLTQLLASFDPSDPDDIEKQKTWRGQLSPCLT